MTRPARPLIGVFDSGFGGLTVLRALLQQLPNADFVYLGDTAHLPYGSKSQATVTRYTQAAIRFLVSRGAELVVIACNTASALALPSLQSTAPVPLVGVIGPGAQAAAAIAPPGGTALVLATEATVTSHAYAQACAALGLHTVEKACPLFVPLVEEGWTDSPITEQIAAIYLAEAMDPLQPVLTDGTGLIQAAEQHGAASSIDATVHSPAVIVLGCTHYPLLQALIQRTANSLAGPIPVVDSAHATAAHTATLLPAAAAQSISEPQLTFYATDSAGKFQRFAPRFLGRPIQHVHQIDLDT